MALEGDIATFPLADLFAWLVRRGASGVLTLSRGMITRRFHLRRGQVRLVSSSEQDMLLGQLLIERKLVGADALARALAGRGRSRARLGRVLTRGGLVTARQLQAILGEKVRRLLADTLTWDQGRFFYEASEPLADPGQQRRRARREDQRGIAVAVDLRAALEQIGREPAPAPAADDCVAVADDDVIEALPAHGD
jgi:Domain of unknown function (DUF4388)